MGVQMSDRYDTAYYMEGNKASDYLPRHGMIVLGYSDVDVVLQLIVYSPKRTADENIFAWAWYDRKGDVFELRDVEVADFDDELAVEDQRLPSKKRIGMVVYKKLTGV